ncbi:MAG: SIS domain-containing protein [Lachnospiraceae bacterium]|jgi:D-arabinose 5-phosphate isomerase GutQ|nr:SIS domain-containing protein [Lachnospiraceae bacterium]
MKSETMERALAAFTIESDSILATRDAIDPSVFAQAVDILSAAPRIGTTGCGHSGIACMHFAHSLCCIERPARFLSPAEAVHGASGFLKEGDVLVWASRGGKTDELFSILDICRTKKVTVIGVTENLDSPLAQRSDVIVPMKVTAETDRYNSQGTSSFTALSAVFDALQTAVIEETGYQNEQFALIHPGGAVGKRLNKNNT